MPESTPVTLIAGTLPPGYCWVSPQQFNSDIFAIAQAYLAGQYRAFNYGNSTPTVDDRSNPWRRLEADGSPDGWYDYFNGEWVAKYRVPVGSPERMIWTGSLADLQTYDGGEVAAVTDTTGPFWEEDTDFQARIPIGVGTLPLSGTTIAVGGDTGVDQVTLTTAQIPAHTHTVTHGRATADGNFANPAGGLLNVGGLDIGFTTDSVGGGLPHTNVPPVRGVYYAKRTLRKFWRV